MFVLNFQVYNKLARIKNVQIKTLNLCEFRLKLHHFLMNF